MNVNDAKAKLESAGLNIISENRLPNGTGTQLRLDNESIVNVFDKGTLNVQGKNREAVEEVLGANVAPKAVASSPVVGKGGIRSKVFVVYGHDQPSRDQLEAMLRRWRLEPLILDQLATEGQTVIEKLESAMAEASFGVVLATPDDEGHRVGRSDEKAFRARQNVVLEMGMLLARLGRKACCYSSQDTGEHGASVGHSGAYLHSVQGRHRERGGCLSGQGNGRMRL